MILTTLNSNAVASPSIVIYDRSTSDVRYNIPAHVYYVGLAVPELVLIVICHDQTRLRLSLLNDRINHDVLSYSSHFALTLVMIQLVLKIVVATLTAFSSALLVTFKGSMIPISIMFPTTPSFTSKPYPKLF